MKCCVTKPPDLTKESINKSGNIVEHVMVLDSTNNGFRVVYTTAEAVTNEKYEEIRGRPHIRTRFDRLNIEAPKHLALSTRIALPQSLGIVISKLRHHDAVSSYN